MKHYLLTMALAVGALSASADVTLVVADGAGQQKYGVADIGKIAFTGSTMDIYGKDATRIGSFDLAEITKLFFSDGADGVAEINPDGALKFKMTGNVITVDGLTSPADAYVVAANGRVAMAVGQWDGAQLDVASLPSGVYVLAVGRAAFKFIK